MDREQLFRYTELLFMLIHNEREIAQLKQPPKYLYEQSQKLKEAMMEVVRDV